MTRTILVYGDSNTHGTLALAHLDDVRRLPRGERWPDVMAALLAPDWDVIAEGHPGRTTVHADPVEGAHRSGLAVLPAILESHRPVDLVILKLGTNDLKARFAVTAGDIALSLGRLVREIAGSGAGPEGAAPAVMIVAPPPILEAGCLADMFSGGAEKSRALAPLAAAEAARQEAAFFDAGTVIAVDPVDGIHYDAAAHAALGRAMAQAVRRHWP
jgi:lysophospholipase L1-like esterase